ncbi:hypothetical protein FNF29_08427 [Cafeteria roenbergensis]|uniref:Uncharacterized protein n=1 Tax=Cafeteria roenbergensis TaxID=33653 RepID=A0A5A8C0V9_CAFRO|nr:hypothetical protein FNF29_08427 [Cafeteria roenbergensis]|eukprot:KAA0145700.1 hypothetical protein FNF29_08427 [Cafeteria roenbergensis]
MTETATAMVENLAWTARLLGKVPNGARAYYEVTVGKEKLYRYNVSGLRPTARVVALRHGHGAKQAGAPPGSQAALSLWGNIASAGRERLGLQLPLAWRRGRDMTTARTSSIVPADLNSIVVMQLRAAARLERVGGAAGSGTTASQYEATRHAAVLVDQRRPLERVPGVVG